MSILTAEQDAALDLQMRAELWRRGQLSWKLDESKREIYDAFQAAPRLSQFVFEASRKVGKSFLALVIAFEACIANPGCRVNYGCGTSKAAFEIVVPLIAKVAKDAPPELKPEYSSQTGHITFPEDGPAKGAFIVLFGCEDHQKAERGRGPEAVLNILDEAGFIPILGYVLSDVLGAQAIHTKGKALVMSSPPLSPGHEFCGIADAAANLGLYAHRNIYSPDGQMTVEEADEYVAAEAAKKGLTVEQFKLTSTYRREIKGLRVIAEELAIIPGFSLLEAEIVRDHPRPDGFRFVDTFVAIDPGKTDFSGGLFAYNDYLAGLIVIEDEFLLTNASSTRPLADAVKAKEGERWPGKKPPRVRVIDDDGARLIPDFWSEHKLSFSPARKDDRDSQIALMNLLFNGKKVVIHPRCKQLIRQLRNAVRTKPGGDMARTTQDGHYDLVAACRYLVRLMNDHKHRNPYPPDWNLPKGYVRTRPLPPPVNGLSRALLGGTPLGRKLLRSRTKQK